MGVTGIGADDVLVDPARAAELAAVASAFGLGRIESASPARHGTGSKVYHLRTPDGDFVVKFVGADALTDWRRRQLDRELAVLRHLGAIQFPYSIPRPLTNCLGGEALTLSAGVFWAYRRIAGSHPRYVSPQILAELAAGVGAYSAAMRGCDLKGDADFPATGRLRSEVPELQRIFLSAEGSETDAASRGAPGGSDTIEKAALFLDACSFGSDLVMAHSDFHWVNVLFDEADRLVGIVDFGLVKPAPAVWDLADAITHYCYDGHTLNVARAAFFITHYARVCPVSTEQVRQIGPAILFKYFLELRHFATTPAAEFAASKATLVERAVARMQDLLHRGGFVEPLA